MNLHIITAKTVPCTSCQARIRINKTATMDDHGRRVFDLKCKKCGALVEYTGSFIDDVLAGRQKV